MFYQTIYNIDESTPYVYSLKNKSNRSVCCIFYDHVIDNMADISTLNGKKVTGTWDTNWLGKKVTGKKLTFQE